MDPVTGEVRVEWPVTDLIRVPASTTSGYYLAQVVLTSGPQARSVQDVPFVVRARPEELSRVLVQVPVTTCAAYNPWGGSCVYRHPVCGRRAVNVSFDRPYGWESPLQNPLHWELPLIHFLELYGVDVSYQTDADTDADPSSLLAHRLVISAGHSEYWTKTMFDAFDAARDAGTNLAFMGANNVYWPARDELNHRRIVVYKNTPGLRTRSRARDDPLQRAAAAPLRMRTHRCTTPRRRFQPPRRRLHGQPRCDQRPLVSQHRLRGRKRRTPGRQRRARRSAAQPRSGRGR